MKTRQELEQQIIEMELDLEALRVLWRSANSIMQKTHVMNKGIHLKKEIESVKKDLGIVERQERALAIAQKMDERRFNRKMRREGMKTL